MNYYNEHNPKAAAWLRELMRAGLIPAGDVDERSIKDVRANELVGYCQCHFFAGIGGWPLAFRLAGWPEDRPAWTGSCPCQPFSGAGKRKGAQDSRHLWPWFRHLIFRGRPPVTFGEQVASADGRVWLSGVRGNLETLGYAVGSADLCAAGIGAPHIRQRLYWVADADLQRCERRGTATGHEARSSAGFAGSRTAFGMANANGNGCRQAGRGESPAGHDGIVGNGCVGRLADVLQPGLEGHAGNGHNGHKPGRFDPHAPRSVAPRGGAWDSFDLLPCTDGKARRVEPGTFPLAHGIPARVGRLRGYGNAILPHLAAEFVGAWLETNLDNNPLVASAADGDEARVRKPN